MFNILWLEDTPEAVRYEINALKELKDCRIEVVEWPDELMSRLDSDSNKYDLLLIDIMIPGVRSFKKDGVEYRTRGGIETGIIYYEHEIKGIYKGQVVFFTARSITPELRNEVNKHANCELFHKTQLKTKLLPYLQTSIQKKMEGHK